MRAYSRRELQSRARSGNARIGDPCLGAVGQLRDDGVFNEGRLWTS